MTCRCPRHRAMIVAPSQWPWYPLLPLVRSREGRLDLGVLADAGFFQLAPGLLIVRANLLLVPWHRDELLSLPSEVFGSIDELLAAGWRVD